ncbi:hypothetical protein, partial [Chroococcus sp. FPU101]|uniref:hypothetical protein n=1 Tax=Chroococcus sp. FPU101 TaxID=1974212 RepID=UPI001A90068A
LQSCGALSWWIGDYAKARQDWDKNGTSLSQELLALSEGKPALSNHLIVQAFNQPNSRMTLLRQAWIIENKEDLPTSLEGVSSTHDKLVLIEKRLWSRDFQNL